MLLKALAPELHALIERSTDAALTQPQLVTLMGEPAQREQLSSNDIENLLGSRASFLGGPTAACRPERPIRTFSIIDPCTDRAPTHVQTAAVPIVRHLQTTHAITQPSDASAGGMDDMTDQLRIDNVQTVRITLAQ
jgi:hypothetical protein